MIEVLFHAAPLAAAFEVLFIMGFWHITTHGRWAASIVGWATMSLLCCVGLWALLALLWGFFPDSPAMPPAAMAVFAATILTLGIFGAFIIREHALNRKARP